MFRPRLVSLLGVLSLLFLGAFAQNNYFITPPTPGPTGQFDDNNVYALGSTINLQWKTNYTTISLALWQNDNNSYILLLDSVPASQTLRWDVDFHNEFNITSASLATPNVFFFQMWEIVDGGNIGDRFSAHYFNITGDQSSPATTSAASSSTTSTPTSSATTASTTTSSTAAASTSSSPSSGLSSSATIGIGVGVGVGVACLLAGAAIGFFFWRKCKKGAASSQQDQSRNMEQAAPPYFGNSPGGGYTPVQQNGTPYYDSNHMAKSQLSPPTQPTELSGEGQTHELQSTQAQSYELPGSR
ncbi:hypothetical protein M409DRAFT_26440 [Zasmidium cellare ATCC 36951]|uniref:Mid2 domain-containing protein n=1 Tax=Zasmidium cellare ATCC 36951 TaxID=1080233 RepID=A0A6A6CAR1_ZASCE|nr:uncharacterized protein M409DRAFT_26440 [Zasmidium cellare ATCC 36951]KAF2162992.1 hypothetical protein M409DRAFT_26440 [Zasmidium cellare ATCC 36951]